MEEIKKPFKWIDKEEWDFHSKQLPSIYICGCDPVDENGSVSKAIVIDLNKINFKINSNE